MVKLDRPHYYGNGCGVESLSIFNANFIVFSLSRPLKLDTIFKFFSALLFTINLIICFKGQVGSD